MRGGSRDKERWREKQRIVIEKERQRQRDSRVEDQRLAMNTWRESVEGNAERRNRTGRL